MGRRARVERDDDGAAPALPRVPAAFATRRRRAGVMSELLARQRAGRTVVDLPRRRARPERDDRGVCGASAGGALRRRRPQLAEARRFCEERGGIGGARVFTRIWLALFGVWHVARGARSCRPSSCSSALAARFSLHVRLLGAADASCRSRSSCTTGRCGGCRPGAACHELTSDAGRARRPQRLGRRRPAARALRRIAVQAGARARARDSPSAGSSTGRSSTARWGGIQPPWVWSLIALACAATGPTRRTPAGARGLERLPRRRRRPAPARGVPVAGVGQRPRPARARASRESPRPSPRSLSASAGFWRRKCGRAVTGRFACPASSRAAGRSSSRTTSIRTSTTRRSSPSRSTSSAPAAPRSSAPADGSPACSRRTGAGAAFDVDNDAYWLYDVPFCDFGAVIDPPSVDVTAHVVELLAREPGYEDGRATRCRLPPARAGGGRLLVRAAGASTTSTARAPRYPRSLPPASRPSHRRCAGPSPGSRRARTRTAGSARTVAPTTTARTGVAWRGRGVSTPSQTAWALTGLVAGGRGAIETRPARAAAWLCEQPARRRRLGRGALHRHRLPARLPDPLPPLPHRLADDRARPLPRGASSAREGLRHRSDRLRRRTRRARARRAGRRGSSTSGSTCSTGPGSSASIEGCDAVVPRRRALQLRRRSRDDRARERRRNAQRGRGVPLARACAGSCTRALRAPAGRCPDVRRRRWTRRPPGSSRVPYKRTKLAAERLVLEAAGDGLDAVVVNPTTPVGRGRRQADAHRAHDRGRRARADSRLRRDDGAERRRRPRRRPGPRAGARARRPRRALPPRRRQPLARGALRARSRTSPGGRGPRSGFPTRRPWPPRGSGWQTETR